MIVHWVIGDGTYDEYSDALVLLSTQPVLPTEVDVLYI